MENGEKERKRERDNYSHFDTEEKRRKYELESIEFASTKVELKRRDEMEHRERDEGGEKEIITSTLTQRRNGRIEN